MNSLFENPFEFEYDEQTNNVITKSNLKFCRKYDNLDKTKEYIKINFNIYKIDKSVDYFTWLNEPDSEIKYQIELFFEIDIELVNSELNDLWLSSWYLNSKFSTDKIQLYDTYIPISIEFISFV